MTPAWSFANQIGKPGNCFAAQVFNEQNKAIIMIEPREDPEVANNLVRRVASIPEMESELAKLREENDNLKSVMIAAAEEIQAHWQAHCDENGYGPANLMHRLEKGIPAHYAYKAGNFERLREENEELTRLLDAAKKEIIKYNKWENEDSVPPINIVIELRQLTDQLSKAKGLLAWARSTLSENEYLEVVEKEIEQFLNGSI